MFQRAILSIGLVVLAGMGYWYLTRDEQSVERVGYQTQPASVGRVESIVNTAGTINPVLTVEVGSELSGLVSELYADFNSEVKSGEVIARIDDRMIRARLKQIEADVAAAHASLQQQEANVNRMRADLDLARVDGARQRELVGRQLVSQADVDRAEANLKSAEAQLEVANAQVAGARAAVLQREAQLEQTQLDLERTYIRSPVDGTVIDRQVDVGQTVAASLAAPTLFRIAQDLTKMRIEADVDEADIGQIAADLAARFTVDAHPDDTFTGTVTQVRKAATVTSNVVTYKVIINAENPREQLLPGMTANVNIVLGERAGVLRVSNSALRFNPPGADATPGPGAFAGAMTDRLNQFAAELALDARQRRAVETALGDMQSAMAAAARDSLPAGPPVAGPPANARERMTQLRQRMTNQLAGVLSSEQLARFEQSFAGGPGAGGFPGGSGLPSGPPGSDAAAPAPRPGQVWVLENGNPKPIRVLVGLSDGQYTEVRSQELKDGDPVIVRLSR